MTLPEYLQYAIEHEKRCIKMREKQVEGYKKRIVFLESGMDYYETQKKVSPVTVTSFNIKFEKNKYFDLKKQHNVLKSERKKIKEGENVCHGFGQDDTKIN